MSLSKDQTAQGSRSSSTTPQSRRHSSMNLPSSPTTRTRTTTPTPTRTRSLRVERSSERLLKDPNTPCRTPVQTLKPRPASQKRFSLPVGKRDISGPSSPNQLPPSPSPTQKQTPRKPLITDVNNIKVITRFRPENSSERAKSQASIIKDSDETSVSLKDGTFTYDRVFGPESTQCDVFNYSVLQTVDDFFNGYNGTVLAYGQTGSGKTFTMMGDLQSDDLKGLTPRIAESIFKNISKGDPNTEFTLSASYMEIYMEQIRDLLSSTSEEPLQVIEDKINGVHVKNLTKAYIASPEELHLILQRGSELRITSSTEMNKESSRSHAIFQLNLNQESPEFGIRRSKLFLVDLAGSEKVGKTGVSGLNLEEAKKINSSLSSLGNVINALTDSKSTHIPYRDSKLTRILQESLGGNSRTSLIINCSPSSYNEFETLSTLRFGTRAKKIKNKAHVNIEPSSQDLLKQIEMLRRMNEDQMLRNRELEYELELWKTGVSKFEASDENDAALKNEETKDEKSWNEEKNKISEKLKEGNKKIVMFMGQLMVYKDILTKIPNYKEGEDADIYEQLKTSQIINESLMIDVTNKCEKLISMEMEIDSLEQELHRLSEYKLEQEKLLALEKTVEHLNMKLDELELQNNMLRKDVHSTKKISETRNERIKTLELLIKDQQSQISRHERKTSEPSSSFFKMPFFYRSSSGNNSSQLSNVPDPSFDQYRPSSEAIDGDFDSYNNNSTHRSATRHLSGLSEDGDVRNFDRPQSISSSNSSISHSGSVRAGGGRVGFNLHIVKPMRGGAIDK